PDHKMIGDLFVCLIVSPLEGGECAIREDDAPTISHIRRIALNDGDIVCGMCLFDEQPAIETGRSSTEDGDLHVELPGRGIPCVVSKSEVLSALYLPSPLRISAS